MRTCRGTQQGRSPVPCCPSRAPPAPGRLPLDLEADGCRHGNRVRELERVYDGHVPCLYNGAPTALAHAEGPMGKLDRPEESRQKNAAGIVVNLRARTGLKQVDSYEGEAAVPRGPVDGDVLALHDPHVSLKIVRVPVTPLRLADVVGHRGGAVEVGERAWLDVEALERCTGERQRNGFRARRKHVNKIVRGRQPASSPRFNPPGIGFGAGSVRL